MNRVLVLNASYEPLNIASWKRAVVLLIKEKAEQVEHNGKMLRAGFPLPSVIRLRSYIQIPYKEIPLTRRNVLHRDNHTCQYCGYTGEGFKTVLPSIASAKISFRLVGDQDPHTIRENFRAYVQQQLPADCTVSFAEHGASPGIALSLDDPAFEKSRIALSQEWENDAVLSLIHI